MPTSFEISGPKPFGKSKACFLGLYGAPAAASPASNPYPSTSGNIFPTISLICFLSVTD